MKQFIIIFIILLFFSCVPKTIVKTEPFELCPAQDVVIIGNYQGFMVPILLDEGLFNEMRKEVAIGRYKFGKEAEETTQELADEISPNRAWLTLEEWNKIMNTDEVPK